jgi:hypothetical protein
VPRNGSAGYEHPGKSFISRNGPPESGDAVLEYARFLREESDLTDVPPIDLLPIYARFGIPEPRRADLPGQQGLLINPEAGLIIINESDISTRQRFTEAHELMELLFAAFKTGGGWAARQHGPFKRSTKESLCNRGAAELLMPLNSYLPRVSELGCSFATGRRLAEQYAVSTTAALVQMAKIGPGSHAIVVWSHRNKPSELSQHSGGRQLSLFGSQADSTPQPRLRVEWSIPSDGGPFIPRHKSVAVDSAPFRAWETGEDTEGQDYLALGQVLGHIFSENHPFESHNERMVISLLHLPNDYKCQGMGGRRRT